MQKTITERAEAIADMLETIERQGDAFVKMAPDYRRLLVQATVLARQLAYDTAVSEAYGALKSAGVVCDVRDCGVAALPGLRVCSGHARGMAAAREAAMFG